MLYVQLYLYIQKILKLYLKSLDIAKRNYYMDFICYYKFLKAH